MTEVNEFKKRWVSTRERLGLTQHDAAKELGVSQGTVCGFEGKTIPQPKNWLKFADQLNKWEAVLATRESNFAATYKRITSAQAFNPKGVYTSTERSEEPSGDVNLYKDVAIFGLANLDSLVAQIKILIGTVRTMNSEKKERGATRKFWDRFEFLTNLSDGIDGYIDRMEERKRSFTQQAPKESPNISTTTPDNLPTNDVESVTERKRKDSFKIRQKNRDRQARKRSGEPEL